MLEGAQPASNGIECPAMPCAARFAASEARTFVPLCGTKVTAFLKAVRKVRPDFFDSLRFPSGQLEGNLFCMYQACSVRMPASSRRIASRGASLPVQRAICAAP